MTGSKLLKNILLIIALLLLALIIFMPLRFALSLTNIPQLSAQSIKGSILSGSAHNLKYKNIALGNIRVSTSALSIFTASPKFHLSRPISPDAPAVNAVIGTSYVERLSTEIDGTSLFADLPVDTIILKDVSARYSEGRCVNASGQINMSLRINIAGQYISRDINGPLQCVSGSLQSTLKSKTSSEILNMNIDANGQYQADIFILGNYPITPQLSDIGFKPIDNGIAMTVSGKL